jgi:hypothetical protein
VIVLPLQVKLILKDAFGLYCSDPQESVAIGQLLLGQLMMAFELSRPLIGLFLRVAEKILEAIKPSGVVDGKRAGWAGCQ